MIIPIQKLECEKKLGRSKMEAHFRIAEAEIRASGV